VGCWCNRDFTPTIKLADNSNMANHGPDPPETLAAASEKFSKFLAAQGYPDKIRWLVRDHVVVETAEANVSSRMMDGCP
jgi:hypothetical protein